MATKTKLIQLCAEGDDHKSVDLVFKSDMQGVLLEVLVLEHVFGCVVEPKKVHVLK